MAEFTYFSFMLCSSTTGPQPTQQPAKEGEKEKEAPPSVAQQTWFPSHYIKIQHLNKPPHRNRCCGLGCLSFYGNRTQAEPLLHRKREGKIEAFLITANRQLERVATTNTQNTLYINDNLSLGKLSLLASRFFSSFLLLLSSSRADFDLVSLSIS